MRLQKGHWFFSLEGPIFLTHMPGSRKKEGRGQRKVPYKRHVNFTPLSSTTLLVHGLIIFYLDYRHSLLNSPSLAQCFLCTAAIWIFSNLKFEHMTPLLRSHHWLVIIIPKFLSWHSKPFIFCFQSIFLVLLFLCFIIVW